MIARPMACSTNTHAQNKLWLRWYIIVLLNMFVFLLFVFHLRRNRDQCYFDMVTNWKLITTQKKKIRRMNSPTTWTNCIMVFSMTYLVWWLKSACHNFTHKNSFIDSNLVNCNQFVSLSINCTFAEVMLNECVCLIQTWKWTERN